jgi:hypothetical protein
MIEPNHFPTLSREELLTSVSELQRQLAELRASNEDFTQRSNSSIVVGSDKSPRFPRAPG